MSACGQHLRSVPIGIWSVHEFICSPAPDVYGPCCPCFLRCHQLSAQIKCFCVVLCNLSTKLISCLKLIRWIGPISAHIAVRVPLVPFNAPPHCHLLHLRPGENRCNGIIWAYLDARLGCWHSPIRDGTTVYRPRSADRPVASTGAPTQRQQYQRHERALVALTQDCAGDRAASSCQLKCSLQSKHPASATRTHDKSVA